MNLTPEQTLLHRDLHKMIKAINKRLEDANCTGVVFAAFNDDTHNTTEVLCNPSLPVDVQVNLLIGILKCVSGKSGQKISVGGDEA